MRYKTILKQQLGDTLTPVSAYLRLNELFTPCVLLESSDYHTKENSYSIICCSVLEEVKIKTPNPNAPQQLNQFIESIHAESEEDIANQFNSVFGYSSFEAVQSFETIQFNPSKIESYSIPDLLYHFYRFILVFNHFNETLYIIENIPEHDTSKLSDIEDALFSPIQIQSSKFQTLGNRTSSLSDEEFKQYVTLGKHHCQIGNVFQLVLARQFQQRYKGDTFLLYRALRSINPSPFSFYFNYGTYQIFGASPEAQLLVRNGLAEIHPIAGTFQRTGNDDEDAQQAKALFSDAKENAEHVMLVDLARNDLSKNTSDVQVDRYKDVQFYSHVIHLVSKVTGQLSENGNSKQLFADTFPAGTLSGAPKFKALQLIDEIETTKRGIYGGAIGAFGLTGDVNHAIAIRSFFATPTTLFYQAGAGIVIDSNEEKENQEVYNKLKALEMAMQKAEELSK